MKEKRLGIWGWWQGNNLGDNWIKKVFTHFFPKAEFIDTSVQRLESFDFVVCGGGGLFVYDVIAPWNDLSSKVLKRTAFGMLGLGAEFPHESKIAAELYESARFFYVRDQYSLDCMNLRNVERSYDVTFAMPLSPVDENSLDMNRLFFVWRDGGELLENAKFRKYISAGASKEEWYQVINRHFGSRTEDDFQTTEADIEERISGCGFVISGRYHGIVAAIQKGLPFIAIDVCPKIRALVRECDLEEYCVKINEIYKIDELIKKAKNNLRIIRKKEMEYRQTAAVVLQEHFRTVYLEMLKVLRPLNMIHYGSYWMEDNDVVNVMADDLSELCNLWKVDLKAYKKKRDFRIGNIIKTPNGMICILKDKYIRKDISRQKADGIILNAGGLTLTDSLFSELRHKNVKILGISLSDPDVYPYNGKIFSDNFDLFYTNSKYSFEKQYCDNQTQVRLMPFAASTKHHYYMPEVEKKYDVVVVGHAREERIKIIERLSEVCKVGIFGNGWERSMGAVYGKEHVKAINSGKMYLSFAQTVAGYQNIKVGLFEAMACNQVVITAYMEELQDYFEIGKEILCYRDENELFDIVKYYSEHPEEREMIRKAGYQRFLKEHTYIKRWDDVLWELYDILGIYNNWFSAL